MVQDENGENYDDEWRRMTVADLGRIIAALDEPTRAALFAPYLFDGQKRGEAPAWPGDDETDADADRILGMSDAELDEEIRATGGNVERVHKWASANAKLFRKMADVYAEKRESESRATRAEARVAELIAIARVGWECVLTTAQVYGVSSEAPDEALARIAEMEKR
jgi:hypothetical protein